MTAASPLSALARAAAQAVRDRLGTSADAPVAGIILGSGLGRLAGRLERARSVPFAAIPGFPATTVAGHAGVVTRGLLGDRLVIAIAGRFHLYEGHDAAVAGLPVRVLHALGARTLFVSNAAGGIRRSLRPGDLMVIDDHVNLMWRNPLIGPIEDGDERFPDMSQPYDRALQALVYDAARHVGVSLTTGVYCGLLGPSYETPAEVRMLEGFGVDAVGMSTVPEVIVARALGMRVAGISCITNMACGITAAPLDHREVLDTTTRVEKEFEALVTAFVRGLA